MIFDETQRQRFATLYPNESIKFEHNLKADERLEINALLDLARSFPPESIEYNAGNLSIEQDPAKTPMTGLSAEETIARIADCQSWIVLKNIEQSGAYEALLDQCIDELEPILQAKTGMAEKREGFIFISSPNSLTPFHIDPEHNILLQIRGQKAMNVLPNRDFDIVPAEQHEHFHGPDGHRNLKFDESFREKGVCHDLHGGDAVYVPVKAPHWVENGDDISVSLSITWRSNLSDRDASLHRANGWLRANGRKPPLPGQFALRDRAVVMAHKIATRLSG